MLGSLSERSGDWLGCVNCERVDGPATACSRVITSGGVDVHLTLTTLG